MGLKKRNKISAEFSMSSLTDIIFLLLIFFMLTSTLVRIDVVDLPEADARTVAPTTFVVSIDKRGVFKLNGKQTSSKNLEVAMRRALRTAANQEHATVTIVAEKGVPFKHVAGVVETAGRLRLRAILATKPKS